MSWRQEHATTAFRYPMVASTIHTPEPTIGNQVQNQSELDPETRHPKSRPIDENRVQTRHALHLLKPSVAQPAGFPNRCETDQDQGKV